MDKTISLMIGEINEKDIPYINSLLVYINKFSSVTYNNEKSDIIVLYNLLYENTKKVIIYFRNLLHYNYLELINKEVYIIENINDMLSIIDFYKNLSKEL